MQATMKPKLDPAAALAALASLGFDVSELEAKLKLLDTPPNVLPAGAAAQGRAPSLVLPENRTTQRSTLSVIEAAELIGVSTTSIYTMVREVQIPHVRVRGRILFHRATIEAWLRGELPEVKRA